MKTKILTLTLNPVIDIHYSLPRISIGRENFVTSCVKFAAGKGVNVASVLTKHGYGAMPYVLLGSEGKDEYLRLLDIQKLPCRYLEVPGPVREYVSLNCTEDGTETRICRKDFTATDEDVGKIASLLLGEIVSGTFVVISGSLPGGVSSGAFAEICKEFRDKGARLIIDCATLSLYDLMEVRPWLIKPNRSEAISLLSMMDIDASGLSDDILAIRLSEHFGQVIVSLGEKGIIYMRNNENGSLFYSMPADKVDSVHSTVGAGDSLIAGFLYGMIKDENDVDGALRTGLKFAAETCGMRR